jgi:hypothetical protein
MTVVDITLEATPLGTFRAPQGARRRAWTSLVLVIGFGAATWGLVSRDPYRYHASTQIVLPVAFLAFASLGVLVRSAKITVTRDGVRWGWRAVGFEQHVSRIATAHVYSDGIALEARRGTWWFLGARDWDRFDALVRQIRRVELPLSDHTGTAPLRARLQSYGRFLDGMLMVSIVGAVAVMLWAA